MPGPSSVVAGIAVGAVVVILAGGAGYMVAKNEPQPAVYTAQGVRAPEHINQPQPTATPQYAVQPQTIEEPESGSSPQMAEIQQPMMPPPPIPVYVVPPPPEPNVIWTPGHWRWFGRDYFWVPGTWVQPPAVGVLWTPGYWGWMHGRFAWHEGYWAPHVGFYGGINYGGGYTGDGFRGGAWNGGVYNVNRTVVNVTNATNVTHVTIVVGFNGGPGGTTAAPTPQDEAVARERHLPPTTEQAKHLEAASRELKFHTSANHGRPAIAAIPKPGLFFGNGAMPVRQAPPGRPAAELPNPPVARNPFPAKNEEAPRPTTHEEEKRVLQGMPMASPHAEPNKKPEQQATPVNKPVVHEEEKKPTPQIVPKADPNAELEKKSVQEAKPNPKPQEKPEEHREPDNHKDEHKE